MTKRRQSKDTLSKTTIRRDSELVERFERVTAKMAYPPSLAAIVRRGFILALDELERTKGLVR